MKGLKIITEVAKDDLQENGHEMPYRAAELLEIILKPFLMHEKLDKRLA